MIKLLAVVCCFVFTFIINGKHDFVNFTLKNGLRVICIKKSAIPIVTIHICYDCGSRCDAIGKSGVAHFLEHMAFHSHGMAFNNFLEEIGAERNAYTSLGYICFYEVVPKEYMEKVLEYESARMRSLDINQEVFASEKKAILEERNMVYDANPAGLIHESLYANIFNRMSGGISVIGWKHEIESIQQQDLFDFHDKWFAPNNAVLILVGDIDPQRIKILVEKHFGDLKAKSLPKIKTRCNVAPSVVKTVGCKSSEANCFRTCYVYRIPFFARDNFRKYLSLSLAVQAMNQSEFFIIKKIKSATNMLNEVNFSFTSNAAYDIVTIHLTGVSQDDMDSMEELWHFLKEKLRTNSGLTDSEINAVKRQRSTFIAHEDDDIKLIAYSIASLLISGYSPEEIMAQDETIQAITQQECNNLITEIFSGDPIAISKLKRKDYEEK
ncbi:MAG: insulinase family protein [Holosporaceae bacterium]|jgi:zinc protease|nr:insulinase family protein [Holosporaceae bacterium]